LSNLEITVKDIVAIIVLVLVFAGIFLDKIPLDVGLPIVTSILFFYLGVKVGLTVGVKHEGN
jgi:hypothetical protein